MRATIPLTPVCSAKPRSTRSSPVGRASVRSTRFDGAVDLRGVSTEKIDFDAGMLSTRHVAALRSNAALPRERLRESPFFQRRVRREREFLRPIAPIVTRAGESPSTFKIDIAHHVPGRMRIRAAALKDNVCASEDARRPREPVYIAEGEFARHRRAAEKIWRGTDGSNPSPSSGESGPNERIVGRSRPGTLSRRGTDGSNPSPSSGESSANLTFARVMPDFTPDHPPGDVPLRRWQTFVDDCGRFLDAGGGRKSPRWAGAHSTYSDAIGSAPLPGLTMLGFYGWSMGTSFAGADCAIFCLPP
jgi:hypothetical protein